MGSKSGAFIIPSTQPLRLPLRLPPISHPSTLIPTTRRHHRRRHHRRSLAVKSQNSEQQQQQQQQLNLSVLRFTLGIAGLDESYLPRWIGVGFGSLVLLNHFLSSPAAAAPAQLRSEALGVCVAAFSIALPYLGRFLEGINSAGHQSLPEGSRQIFVMSEELSVTEKEDMAWASYAILRSTNTVSVLIRVNDALCIRGYWNTPEDVSRVAVIELFSSQIQQSGLLDLKDDLYFPKFTDSQLGKILPKETLSLLVQPVMSTSEPTADTTRVEGFVLLASNSNYAYSDKDRAWIRAVASKFRDTAVKEFQGI